MKNILYKKWEIAKYNTHQWMLSFSRFINITAGIIISYINLIIPKDLNIQKYSTTESISSHFYKWHINGTASWPYKFLNKFFEVCFKQKDHCEKAYRNEKNLNNNSK